MKVLLFITLKIVEVAAGLAAYYGLSYLGFYVSSWISSNHRMMSADYEWYNVYFFCHGILPIAIIFMIVWVACLAIPAWIALNKKWVDKLIK